MVTDGDSLAPSVYKKYDLLPTDDEWSEKILFVEPSEECAKPEDIEKMLLEFKRRGILSFKKGEVTISLFKTFTKTINISPLHH